MNSKNLSYYVELGYLFDYVYDFYYMGIYVLLTKSSNFFLDILETYPYKPDGEIPLIFLTIGRVHITFENKFLYSFLYKRKNGYKPRGICE